MAKITSLRGEPASARHMPVASAGVERGGFAPLLRQQQLESDEPPELAQGPLQKLFQQAEDDATELRRSFTYQGLARYRSSLAAFMRLVVDSSFAVEYQNSRANLSTRVRKRYTILRLLEQQSLELASMALKHQVDELALLARVNRIQGLLVDLLS